MRELKYTKSAIRALRKMPANTAALIIAKIEAYAKDPETANNNVKTLRGRQGFRLRVGSWRVIMDDDGNVLAVLDIGHRCYTHAHVHGWHVGTSSNHAKLSKASFKAVVSALLANAPSPSVEKPNNQAVRSICSCEEPAPRNIRPELLTAIKDEVSSAECNAKLSVFAKVVASASELATKVAANCGVP